ncbi:MAG TPA: carboxypeptidase-like regulatory domain-containing protein [Polyangiaceae bacterium]|nr:carboxypeptidase-like regulatory domain-containing protein [Polyangiaceae bacterium]
MRNLTLFLALAFTLWVGGCSNSSAKGGPADASTDAVPHHGERDATSGTSRDGGGNPDSGCANTLHAEIHLIDQDGVPWAGATVTLREAGSTPALVTTSDEAGLAMFSVSHAGAYQVEAYQYTPPVSPQYPTTFEEQSAISELQVGCTDQPTQLTLTGRYLCAVMSNIGYSISLTVVDAVTGAPICDATVTDFTGNLEIIPSDGFPEDGGPTTTNAQGEICSYNLVGGGTRYISVEKAGYETYATRPSIGEVGNHCKVPVHTNIQVQLTPETADAG